MIAIRAFAVSWVVFSCMLSTPALADLIGVTLAGDVFQIDPSSGQEAFLGATGFVGTNGLARDPGTGTLYSVSTSGLITIDPRTGLGSLVGGGTISMTGMAFSPDGTLYGVRNPFHNEPGGSGGPDVLIRIDSQSGAQTTVGSLVGSLFRSVQALAFVGDRLYGWDIRATGGLFEADPATALGTDRAAGTDLILDIQGMGVSADGSFLWGHGRGAGVGLVRIDPATGLATHALPPLANLYRGIEDLGRVPEPGTWVLMMAGLTSLFSRPTSAHGGGRP